MKVPRGSFEEDICRLKIDRHLRGDFKFDILILFISIADVANMLLLLLLLTKETVKVFKQTCMPLTKQGALRLVFSAMTLLARPSD